MEVTAIGPVEGVRGMSKPRVLVVGAFPSPERKIFGGLVTSCRALMASSFVDRYVLDLIDSTQLSNPPPGFFTRMLFAIRRIVRFVWLIFRSRPDCVLLFAAIGMSLVEKGFMGWIARLVGVPVLIFPRGGPLLDQVRDSSFSRIWIRFAFGGASKVLCQGPAWQRFAIETLKINIDCAPIVPNWTASTSLLAIGRERAQPATEKPLQFLFLGWLERDKGIFELLEVCAHLARDYSFSLAIAGKGHAESLARDFIDANGLAGRVQFLGWVQGPDLERALKEADVFVSPSWAEGLPNALVEAMAAGLAVVISAVGNVPDVVRDGVEGLLVSPKDIESLERAMIRMLQETNLRGSLAKQAHQAAAEKFAVEPAVAKLDIAIRSVMRQRTRIKL